MQYAAFNAYCPFEIGDKVVLNNGKIDIAKHHTITDIMMIFKQRSGDVCFRYELDNSGKYTEFK